MMMQVHHPHLHPLYSSSSPSTSTSTLSHFKPPKPFINKPKPKPKPSLLVLSLSSLDPHNNNLTHSDNTLELLNKPEKPDTPSSDDPSDDPSDDDNPNIPSSSDDFADALAPFLKFFKSEADANGDSPTDASKTLPQIQQQQQQQQQQQPINARLKYYDPKRGDFVVGVVVSGNENKLDVNVGADYLGTMLTKEALPLYDKELDYLLCDVKGSREQGEGVLVKGKMGVVRDEEALSREKVEGRPVVEVGTVVFAEVLGRTLSGRPLLSSRRLYRKVAWLRVRQVLGFLLYFSLVMFCF